MEPRLIMIKPRGQSRCKLEGLFCVSANERSGLHVELWLDNVMLFWHPEDSKTIGELEKQEPSLEWVPCPSIVSFLLCPLL